MKFVFIYWIVGTDIPAKHTLYLGPQTRYERDFNGYTMYGTLNNLYCIVFEVQ